MNPRVTIPIFDPTFKADPHPLYRELRRMGPAAPVALPDGTPFWLVTDHDLARRLFLDDRLSKDSRHAGADWHRRRITFDEETSRPVFAHLLTMDAPRHTELRRIVWRNFTPQQVEAFRPSITSLVRRTIDQMPTDRVVDLAAEFALVVPLITVCELLGVPSRDRSSFHRWSTVLMAADESQQALVPEVATELTDYLLQLADAQRTQPDGSLFGRLVAEHDLGNMTEAELVGMGFILLMAGHETTASLLSGGLLALLESPDVWWQLGRDPSLADQVVEDLVRFCAPVDVATPRFARRSIEVGALTIAAGDAVFLGLGAANRDPSCFDRPDQITLDHDTTGHLGFGLGSHACLGAHLARLQATIAFVELSRRFPNLTVVDDGDDFDWKPGLIVRGPRRLPVRLEPGP